jgi:phosphatidylglycerophosphatase A
MSERGSTLARVVATVGGLGDLLPAPGTTAGSLPAALLWWVMCIAVPTSSFRIILTGIGLAVAVVIGTWAADSEARRRRGTDPGPVVVDEVAGQWLTFLIALLFLPEAYSAPVVVLAVAGFFIFRFFDIFKPWPIRKLESYPGGFGIMVDDLGAGLYSGGCLLILAHLVS